MDIRVMTLEAKERSSLAHRGVAALGLATLGLAWAVLLVPCLLWLAASHLGRQLESRVRRAAPAALES
jgi:hypothetical protein